MEVFRDSVPPNLGDRLKLLDDELIFLPQGAELSTERIKAKVDLGLLYSIHIDDLSDPFKVLDWINHLMEKEWFTRSDCKELIALSAQWTGANSSLVRQCVSDDIAIMHRAPASGYY